MASDAKRAKSAVRPSPETTGGVTGLAGLAQASDPSNLPVLAAADASVGSQGSGIETLDVPSRARRRMVGDRQRPPTAAGSKPQGRPSDISER